MSSISEISPVFEKYLRDVIGRKPIVCYCYNIAFIPLDAVGTLDVTLTLFVPTVSYVYIQTPVLVGPE